MINLHNTWASLVSLLILTIFIFWLYRDYKIDSFRQKMFRLRDSLFDEAVQGNISFSDEAYIMLRNITNGNIRFAHRLSMPQAIFFVILFKKEKYALGETFSERFEDSMSKLPDAQRKIYEDYFLQMNFTMVEHIVLSSPLFILTVLTPLLFVIIAQRNVSKTVAKLKPSLDKIEAVTLANEASVVC